MTKIKFNLFVAYYNQVDYSRKHKKRYIKIYFPPSWNLHEKK